jgi:hypothetical protein
MAWESARNLRKSAEWSLSCYELKPHQPVIEEE